MGTWTQGMIGLAGLTVDAVTGLGNLGVHAQNAQTNRELAQAQLALMSQNLQVSKTSLEAWKLANDPGQRYLAAVKAGLDPASAERLAGKGAPNIRGLVEMGPVTVREADGLRGTAMARGAINNGMLFQKGAPGPYRQQAGRPFANALEASRRLSFSSSVWSGSTASTRLTPSRSGSLSSLSSVSSVGSSRPVVVRPGATQYTWVPGSDA